MQSTPRAAAKGAPSDVDLTATATELLALVSQYPELEAFLRASVLRIAAAAHADYAAVANLEDGRWTVIAETGMRRALPAALLSEALDREALAVDGLWHAMPLEPRSPRGEMLILSAAGAASAAATRAAATALAPVANQAMAAVRTREHERRRLARLEALLEITSRWNQTYEMEALLAEIARAATRLLKADRASIFLWDRPNRTLVGRPALGVEGDELRVPDDAGVVGQVIKTGQPRRVDRTSGQELINRRVDAKLGYQTRTLLCVPLRGASGELFGAFEVINKLDGDFSDEDEAALVELASHASIALANTQERQRLLESRRQITEQAARGVQLIGQSSAIEALRSTIRRVAATDLPILILGENGTGKEVVSQAVHYLSARRDQPLIAVNCAALTETLLESELFGHEKGAFTDAHESRAGKFELASGGTLFLDEIGDLSRGGQAKLLRVLEEKVVVRVGGSKSIHTDARVIAATNQNLADMVREKRFRQDLYFRLNVVTLFLPPLRDRVEDVVLLAEHFLDDFCRKARRKPPKLSSAARRRLESHAWPGNIRELRNLMERIAYLSQGDRIEVEDLSFILSPPTDAANAIPGDLELSDATVRFQTDYIQKAIDRARGNMSEAARQLGLHRSNLYRKMRQLGMHVVE